MAAPITAEFNGIQFVHNERVWGYALEYKEGVDIVLNDALKEQYPELYELGKSLDTYQSPHINRASREDLGNNRLSKDEMRLTATWILKARKARKQYEKLIAIGREALVPARERARVEERILDARHDVIGAMLQLKLRLRKSPDEWNAARFMANINDAVTFGIDFSDPARSAVREAIKEFAQKKETLEPADFDGFIDMIGNAVTDAPLPSVCDGVSVRFGEPLKAPDEEG